jgi:hypothetical protein
MTLEWASQFPVVRNIPRGYLIFSDIEVIGYAAPIIIHPFTVMEYWDGPSKLLDYVYVTADTSDPNFRGGISEFFDNYCKERDRQGKYLLSSDISDPLWDAVFQSPEELRRAKQPQLKLIEERVSEALRNQNFIEALLRVLSLVADHNDLRRWSEDAGVDWRRWSRGGTIAEESAYLVAEAVEANKIIQLVQIIFLEYPHQFQADFGRGGPKVEEPEREEPNEEDALDYVSDRLSNYKDHAKLRELSEAAGINCLHWWCGGTVDQERARLIAYAQKTNKLPNLAKLLKVR